jgi:hypothetical protein
MRKRHRRRLIDGLLLIENACSKDPTDAERKL